MRRSPALEPKNAQWYAEHYYSVEDDIIPTFERLDTPLLDRKLKPGMAVFDAMMGRGRHAIRYAKRGCRVWGNDLNPHMVALVRKSAKAASVPRGMLTLTNLDATDLKGVPSDRFDVSFAMYSSIGTIPGSRNRQKAMDEIARVTRPGGLVIIHAHNRLDALFEREFWPWVREMLLKRPEGFEPGDILMDYNGLHGMFNHFYSPGELRRSLRKAGLKVVEEHYENYGTRKTIRHPFRRLVADGFVFVGKKR